MSQSPPINIPCTKFAEPATFNTPTAMAFSSLEEYPFHRQADALSNPLDLSQLHKHLHKVEMSRLGDDLAFAMEAW